MQNLAAVLEAAGSALDRVVKTTIFVADLGDFAAVNEVYGSFFAEAPPARSTVQVAGLPAGAAGRDRGHRPGIGPLREAARRIRPCPNRFRWAAPAIRWPPCGRPPGRLPPARRVYAVGGPVRDLLRGAPSRDADIAVEGDAVALAAAPGRLRSAAPA